MRGPASYGNQHPWVPASYGQHFSLLLLATHIDGWMSPNWLQALVVFVWGKLGLDLPRSCLPPNQASNHTLEPNTS